MPNSFEYKELRNAFEKGNASAVASVFNKLCETDRIRYRMALQSLLNDLGYQDGNNILNELITSTKSLSPKAKLNDIYNLYAIVFRKCLNEPNESGDKFNKLLLETDDPAAIHAWMKLLTPDDYSKLASVLQRPENKILALKLLNLAFKLSESKFIMQIATNDLFTDTDIPAKYPDLFQAYLDINGITDPVYRQFVIDRIYEFHGEFGKITYDGVLLSFSSLCEAKKISPPTLVVEYKEGEYFSCLSKMPRPFTERFIYRDVGHWMACEVHADSDGHLQLLLLDSLGLNHSADNSGTVEELLFGKELIEAALKFDKHADIYILKEARQFSDFGCSVFSLDDIRHLESMAKYIDSEKYPGGIFDYLNKNSESLIIENARIKRATTPLRLMRTLQSSKLLNLMTSSSEADLPLNKKGVTGHQFAATKSGFFNNEQGKSVNRRLEKKFANFARRNLDFLLKHTYNEVKSKMAAFEIKGLRERVTSMLVKSKGQKSSKI